jgi:hypothetical protein
MNKKVISYVNFGRESHPPYISDTSFIQKGGHIPLLFIYLVTLHNKRKNSFVEKYADIVFASSYTSQFLKNKFVNQFELGIPFTETSYFNL